MKILRFLGMLLILLLAACGAEPASEPSTASAGQTGAKNITVYKSPT